jgi:hypothetical protein
MQSEPATGVARPNGVLFKGSIMIDAAGGLPFEYDTAVIAGAEKASV